MQRLEQGSVVFYILIIGLIITSGYLFIRQYSIYRRDRFSQQAYFLLFFSISPIFAIITAFIVIFEIQELITIAGLIPRLMPLIPISLLFVATVSQLNLKRRYLLIPIFILTFEAVIWVIVEFSLLMLTENVKLPLERLPQLIFVMFLLFWIIITFFTFYRSSREYTALGFLFSAIFYTIAGFLALSTEEGILGFLLIFSLANMIIIISIYMAREYPAMVM